MYHLRYATCVPDRPGHTGLDMQQKSPVRVDMPQPYSRKGLRGVDVNHVNAISL